MIKARGDPKLKIRLFPPSVDAEGSEAIQTLARPMVLLPIAITMIVLGLAVTVFGGGSIVTYWPHLIARWFG